MKTIRERLLRLPEVLERVPFMKTTLYRLMRESPFHSDSNQTKRLQRLLMPSQRSYTK